MRLNGKVCIITGTGGSMGRAAAARFAAEGAAVVGCDTNPDAAQETLELVRAAGGRMSSLHPVDLTTVVGCQKLVEFAIGQYGRIDGAHHVIATEEQDLDRGTISTAEAAERTAYRTERARAEIFAWHLWRPSSCF